MNDLDQNRNGQFDQTGEIIPDVAVTNGRDIELTNQDGLLLVICYQRYHYVYYYGGFYDPVDLITYLNFLCPLARWFP